MSLADKVAALRAFFGVHPEVQLLSTEARTRAAGCCWSQWRQRRTLMHELCTVTCNLSLGEVGGEAPFLRGFGAKVKARFLMRRFLNARE